MAWLPNSFAPRVDIIVAWQTPPAQAANQATKEIPIVMTGVGDPVATGLIASLAHPGGNVTGHTAIAAELQAKVVELIRETLPSTRRVTVLANATDPFTKPFLSADRAGGSETWYRDRTGHGQTIRKTRWLFRRHRLNSARRHHYSA